MHCPLDFLRLVLLLIYTIQLVFQNFGIDYKAFSEVIDYALSSGFSEACLVTNLYYSTCVSELWYRL